MAGPTPYTCRSCSAALDDADDTASKGYVKCRFCGTLNDVAAARTVAPPSPTRPPASTASAPPRVQGARRTVRIAPRDPSLPAPKGFTVDCDATTLTLVKRWRTAAVGCLLVFALFWNGFIAAWVLGTGHVPGGLGLVFGLFSIPFVLVGLGLLYACAATLVNRTTITASASVLSVHVGPLPWRRTPDLDPSDLEQIYAQTKTSTTDSGTSTWGVVTARLRGGVRKPIAGSIRKLEDAQFVAETLAAFYGLDGATFPGGTPGGPPPGARWSDDGLSG